MEMFQQIGTPISLSIWDEIGPDYVCLFGIITGSAFGQSETKNQSQRERSDDIWGVWR